MDLSAKTYVITGATSGIGMAAAEALVRAGAGVIGVGRSAERCRAAEAHLRGLALANNVRYVVADLSLQADIHRLGEQIKEMLSSDGTTALDGLVNNAGVFTYWLTLTPDGVETQWAVNHLAPFLLTWELLPLLKAAPFGRVVTVSSGSHYGARLNWADPQLRRRYNGLQAYGNTKLANVLFSLALNHHLGTDSTVRAFAADPGLVKTDIGMKGTPALVRWIWQIRRSGGTSSDVPARSIVFLLTDPSLHTASQVYWKDSLPKQASREALDVQSAARLWELSEKMCGIKE